ncbi:MAG: DUF6014 family protein [Polyangiaceae bacterium]
MKLSLASSSGHGLTPEIEQAIGDCLSALERGAIAEATAALGRLLAANTRLFPRSWLERTIAALGQNAWGGLSEPFASSEFVGPGGHFLIVAPYAVMRQARTTVDIMAIVGRLIPFAAPSIAELEAACRERFGALNQKMTPVLAYERLASRGLTGHSAGEAFLVPDRWGIPNSAAGPAINDLTEQRRRFAEHGARCLRRIWDEETAEFLIAPLISRESDANRSLEYQIHDAGHAAGMGFGRKVTEELLPTFWNCGVEEWRADGVAFDFAASCLDRATVARIIKVNIAVRLALDAHRNGGLDRDADVCASLLTLDRLLESGLVTIRGGRLAFRNCSDDSLFLATEPHREDAIRLTRDELLLEHGTGLLRLHGSIRVGRASERIFRGLVVEPCAEVYSDLP